ncbi:Serine/threonine-protein phosphatase CPPED1 [Camelus dromedarius]|uniref:Serine/threonine-protein phosphatase CPPED1 n=1 Tax=Camelus dromedarius TaxID=9838 RepID=A0A5N4CX97_CAMDR|nr:Serine/threonine-protein phosphatase CPPED1 [Camelus dromedarius]
MYSLFSKVHKEREWKGPFYFIQGADPQFGLMKAWSMGDCDSGGDEWGQEIRLTELAVQAINKLDPKPKFFVLCGDLIHAMPDQHPSSSYGPKKPGSGVSSIAAKWSE